MSLKESSAETRLAELRERRAVLELEREQRLFESEERAVRDELLAHSRGLGVNVESLAVRAMEQRNAAQRAALQQSHPAAEGFPLHESFSNYDWFDQSPYGFAGPGFAPVLGSGVGGMLNPISTRMDRRQGRMLPFLQTEQDLMLMRGVARIITTLNCPAQGVINALTNYVVGDKGFQFTVDKKHDHYSLPDGLLESAQDVLDEFEEDAHWADLQAELFMRSRRDGEYFLALHEMPGGKTKARVIEPEQVTQTRAEEWTVRRIREEHGQEIIEGQLDWYWGVLTPLRDVNDVLGFNSVWETEDGSSYYPAGAVQHFKLSDRNVKRGVSDFYPAFRMLQKAGNLAQKIVAGATVQAGIAYIRQHPPGRTQSDVMSWRANQADYTTSIVNPFGGSGSTVYNEIRQDASILDVPNGQEYKYGPMGAPSGNQFIDVLQASLRWIATKWNMPEFLISGDASNSNFASTMVAESPFVKSVRFLQHRYGPRWVAVLWKVIEHAAAWGRFDRFGEYGDFHVLRRVLSISVDYPDVETRNRKEESDRRKQLCDDGMISPATRCAEEGYDYEKEVAKGAKQRPSDISAKAASMGPDGQVTAVQQGDGKKGADQDGRQTGMEPDASQPNGEDQPRTNESAGAVQPSAMLDVNAYGQGSGLMLERRRHLRESAADVQAAALTKSPEEFQRWLLESAGLFEGTDAAGHEHKGKGPGGGQFAKQSGGDAITIGSSTDDAIKSLPSGLYQRLSERFKSLSSDSHRALNYYRSTAGARLINGLLREDKPLGEWPDQAIAAAGQLGRAIRQSPDFASPLTLWRGMLRTSPEKHADLVASLERAQKTGEPYSERAFTSWSLDPEIARSFAAGVDDDGHARRGLAFKLIAKNGLYGDSGEHEVVHAPGTQYRVLRVDKSHPKYDIVEAEQI